MFNYSDKDEIICTLSNGKLLQNAAKIAIKIKNGYAANDHASIHKYSELLGSYVLELSLRGFSITSILRWAYDRSQADVKNYHLNHIMNYSDLNWDSEPDYEDYCCGNWDYWKD